MKETCIMLLNIFYITFMRLNKAFETNVSIGIFFSDPTVFQKYIQIWYPCSICVFDWNLKTHQMIIHKITSSLNQKQSFVIT